MPLNLIEKDQQATAAKFGIRACVLNVKLLENGNVEESGDSDDFDYVETEGGKVIETVVTVESIVHGDFELVIAHPEAILCTKYGE